MRAFSVVGLPASVNYDTAQYRLLEAGDSLYAPPQIQTTSHIPRLTCAVSGVGERPKRMPWKEGSDLLVDRSVHISLN
jgi:hypothetical protein